MPSLRSCALWILAIGLASPAAAVPLQAGDLLVSGFSYAFAGLPEGSCTNEICLVDPATGAVTPLVPIPDPATFGAVSRIVVESPSSVLALQRLSTGPSTWTSRVVRIDLDTGAATPIVSGIDRATKILRTDAGRVFVLQQLGQLSELNLATGALTPLAGSFQGAAAGPNETLVLAGRTPLFDEFGDLFFEMTELDLASGVSGLVVNFCCSIGDLDVGPERDIYQFTLTSQSIDGILHRFGGSAGLQFYGQSEDYQGGCFQVAADLSGNLFVNCVGIAGYSFDEFIVFSPTGAMSGVDLDFGVNAFDFVPVPEPGSAALVGLGVAALARLRRRRRR